MARSAAGPAGRRQRGRSMPLTATARLRRIAASALALAVAAGAAAHAREVRFDAWRGVCDPQCTLASPVEFGLVLGIRPAPDGGLAVTLAPLEPRPGSTIELHVPAHDATLRLTEDAWRQSERHRVDVIDPHRRALVLELVQGARELRVAWHSAAGERRMAELPVAGAGPALDWLAETTGHRVRTVDPEAPGPSWAARPERFLAALDACRSRGEAPIVAVRAASDWTEREQALLVVDERGRERVCVAVRDGSVVTAWRVPGEADAALRERSSARLTVPPSGPCFVHEVLRSPDGGIVGILSREHC